MSGWVAGQQAAPAADTSAPSQGLTLALLALAVGLMWLPPALGILILVGVIS